MSLHQMLSGSAVCSLTFYWDTAYKKKMLKYTLDGSICYLKLQMADSVRMMRLMRLGGNWESEANAADACTTSFPITTLRLLALTL